MIALQTLGLDFGISDLATQLLFQLPNSRTQELEGEGIPSSPPVAPVEICLEPSSADTIGLKLMARACFDPQASPA